MQPPNDVSFEDTNMNQLIHQTRHSGNFANVWSFLIFLSHTYNFITIWYFLGIPDFPTGVWFVFELLTEILLLVDLIMRAYMMWLMSDQWKTMWLLQQKNRTIGPIEWCCLLLASVPQSCIFFLIFRKNRSALIAIPIAASRAIKLLRFNQVPKYFETKEIELHYKVGKSTRTLQVVFYFLLATHMIGCIWLIIGRVDPNRNNWFVVAKYLGDTSKNNWRPVTDFEKYVDAVFYTVATMTGLGYGNITPTTSLEYFVDIFIMIIGSSTYAGFFADFAVEIYKQNKDNIENDQKLE
jgi:hypothetical protein